MKTIKKSGLIGEELGPCPACGKLVCVLYDAQGEPDGLAHPPVAKTFGPNGETGCKTFDELDTNGHAMADYVAQMRKTFKARKN